jgi:hypothetical protein
MAKVHPSQRLELKSCSKIHGFSKTRNETLWLESQWKGNPVAEVPAERKPWLSSPEDGRTRFTDRQTMVKNPAHKFRFQGRLNHLG